MAGDLDSRERDPPHATDPPARSSHGHQKKQALTVEEPRLLRLKSLEEMPCRKYLIESHLALDVK